ncbi:MAG: hypothetical protein EZS28_048079, partial [Streblomastix strix]
GDGLMETVEQNLFQQKQHVRDAAEAVHDAVLSIRIWD